MIEGAENRAKEGTAILDNLSSRQQLYFIKQQPVHPLIVSRHVRKVADH